MKRKVDYWETLSYSADLAIENLTQQVLKNEITVGQMFKSICKLQYTEEDCDMCKETIQKVFDFIVDNKIATYDEAEKAYDENWNYDIYTQEEIDNFLKS